MARRRRSRCGRAAGRSWAVRNDHVLLAMTITVGCMCCWPQCNCLVLQLPPLPPCPAQRSGKSKTPSTGGGGGGGKRQRRGKGATEYTSGQETEEEDEEAFLASVRAGGRGVCRCGGGRRQLGSTLEQRCRKRLQNIVGTPQIQLQPINTILCTGVPVAWC